MLKQIFSSALRNTQGKQDILLLCSRLTLLNLGSRTFHSVNNVKEAVKQESVEKTTDFEPFLSPLELLRKEALKVEEASCLRPRCNWLKEEDEKLLQLVKVHGKRWTFMSRHFIDRSPSTLMNRYQLLTNGLSRGPWSKDELEVLKKLGNGRSADDIHDWEAIQRQLPRPRPLFLIKQKYTYSLNPAVKLGAWSEEESNLLASLILKHGEKNMTFIATLMKTRTRRQCLERWRWQMANVKKGRFTPEEDASIVEAVKKYGENFAVVRVVIGSERTARHISQHYRNMLAPGIDRTRWTPEEQLKVYETCIKNNGDMLKTKIELDSKRGIRDLWNHYLSQKKLMDLRSSSRDKSKVITA